MITVIFISHVSILGGAERSLLTMLRGLDRDRFVPVVVCPPGVPLERRLSETGVRTELVDFVRFRRRAGIFTLLKYAVRYVAAVMRLVRIASECNADVVHSNSTNAQLYGAVAALMRRIPSIWHVRDVVPLGVVGYVLHRISTYIIVTSTAVEETVSRYGRGRRGTPRAFKVPGARSGGGITDGPAIGRGGKVLRIPNGIDVDEWDVRRFSGGSGKLAVNRFRERLGADDGGCIIGMVAALVPWKGHRIFIRAAREVCRIDENVRFVIAGGDTFGDHPGYLDDLRKTCTEASLDGRLTFTGHVEDVMPLMAACDIVVLPSSNEPFGRVILEAMALEKAVVAVGAGGPRDIIEHGVSGILVDPHDHGVIAAEIMKLVDDPDKRRGMGRAGRERVEKWFRIDRIVRDVECVYDAVTRVNAS